MHSRVLEDGCDVGVDDAAVLSHLLVRQQREEVQNGVEDGVPHWHVVSRDQHAEEHVERLTNELHI